jgi:hypothetical protein
LALEFALSRAANTMTTGSLPRWLRHAAVLLGFAVLAVGMTWPLAKHLATHVIKTKWHYDAMVNIHILGSRLHYALGTSPSLKSAYDDYFCAPTPFSIANNENHFGLSLLYAPFYLATHDPLLSYNLLLLLCISLSGFCMYLFVRELSGSSLAGVLSGVAYAFSPYIFFELGRIQLVAAQWIPLFALFLHRSTSTHRLRDAIGLGLTFAMQVGSCLYYAVFLGVYAMFVGGWLLVRGRIDWRRLAVHMAVAGAMTAIPVGAMIYPYFKARQDFPLTRSEDLTAKYAGRLPDFAKVYTENKALTFLRDPAPGPYEPIAFPGFTVLALAAAGLLAPMIKTFKQSSRAARIFHVQTFGLSVIGLGAAVGLSIALRDVVPGLLAALVGTILWRRRSKERLLPRTLLVYACFVLVLVVLFLGPSPFAIQGAQIHGPYQYLYHHVPGLDGIRYVSRFVVLIMLSLGVIAGYGVALLLPKRPTLRALAFVVLLAAMLFELRNAPVALARIPNVSNLSPALKWLAKHGGPEPIATMPAYVMGEGGARNDYLALFHHRRTIDGKSSWMPPITYAYIYETRRFPRGSGTRMMQALGVKYLLILGNGAGRLDYNPARTARILHWLDRRPENYALRFSTQTEFVYEVLPPIDPTVSLLATPALPEGAKPIARHDLTAHASTMSEQVEATLDGDASTKWGTMRDQLAGDWFEFAFSNTRKVVALEFRGYAEAFEAPAAFKISALKEDGAYHTVLTRPALRFYADQVYHPKSFTFRVLLPEAVAARALRIDLLDGVAGHEWAIHEASVFSAD